MLRWGQLSTAASTSPRRADPDRASASGAAGEDARTRLLLGPLSLRTEQKTPLARGAALMARLLPPMLRLSVWLDEALHGREIWARVALAFGAGMVAPTLDYLWTGSRSTLGGFTWTSVVFGFGVLVLARVNGLRSDEGKWDPTLAGTRIRTWTALFFESLEHLQKSPFHVRLATSARALAIAAMSGLLWAGLLGGLRVVFGSPSATTALPFLSGALLLVSAGLELYADRAAPRLQLRTLGLLVPTLALACSGEDDPGYDSATLESYLQAIPEESRLVADVPTADPEPGALTAPADAVLAREGVNIARAVNEPARLMVRALRTVVELPPTFFDSEEKQFVWGPWQNDEGVGDVFVYIQENAPGADFKYSYALARTMDGDLATATAVIWGGATPDPEDDDKGVGVTLWDLEANLAFELEHDASAPDQGRGRFVMVYGHQAEQEREAFFNVAVFRNFVPGDNPTQQPADIDYFYGRFMDGTNSVDFVETEVTADICDAPADAAASPACFDDDAVRDQDESFSFVTLFINGGLGRAEATVTGGDVSSEVSMTECWGPSLDRTFFRVVSGTSSAEAGSCVAPADQPMSTLGLPSLATLDPALVEKLSCAAEHGVAGCP